MKKAIAYLRTATREVSVQSDAINHQEIAIKGYCKEHSIDLIHVFHDVGSGMNFEREGWNDLEVYLKESGNKIDFLIVIGYDRISRDKVQTLFKITDLEKKFDLSVLALSASPDLKNVML